MSTTFTISGKQYDFENEDEIGYMNLSNSNATDILNVLGINPNDEYGSLYGSIRARDLRKKCEIALKTLSPVNDESIPQSTLMETGKATIINCGRESGYLTKRIGELLKLSQMAGELGMIVWH
jgi:RAB protein geranylgeranyltransferase component A